MLSKEIIIRRLATIKYLYRIGVEQSFQVETVAGFSILAFHDCVEMFLVLVAENKNKKAEYNFLEYWTSFSDLTMKESMKALSDRRKSIKHRGQFPSKNDIEISRVMVSNFLEENTPIQFGIKFEDVSITNLITFSSVKSYLDLAEDYFNKGAFYESLVECKKAFLDLLICYDNSKLNGRHSIVNIGDKIGSDYQKLVGHDDKLGHKWFRQISETTNNLREILKITALGIDYRKYTFFNAATPEVSQYVTINGSEFHAIEKSYYEGRRVFNAKTSRFCIDFVIDSALKLQEFDFDISQLWIKS